MKLSPPLTNDIQGTLAWARRLVDELNRFFPSVSEYPVYADDASAAAARVQIGDPYVTPDGVLRRRMA